jgi:hypothetical protein
MDSIHGRISLYSKECSFSEGERLYLRRVLTDKGADAFWVYQVENSDSVSYRINEYRNPDSVSLQSWFENGSVNPVNLSTLVPENGQEPSDTLSGISSEI